MKGIQSRALTYLSVLTLVSLGIPAARAQGIGYGGMGMGYGGMGMGYGGMGMMGYGGMGMGPEGGPGATVTVKYGEKVYDAVFGDLIDYKVYFIQVPSDTIGVHYFDDGTHGDEVAFDGMPSNITINRETGEEKAILRTTKANPWVAIQTQTACTMAQLATKLRLCANSRLSNDKAAREKEETPKNTRRGLMFGGK